MLPIAIPYGNILREVQHPDGMCRFLFVSKYSQLCLKICRYRQVFVYLWHVSLKTCR